MLMQFYHDLYFCHDLNSTVNSTF